VCQFRDTVTVPGKADEPVIEEMVTVRLNRRALHPYPRRQATGRAGWVHEIKHDGYPLIVHRGGDPVRPFTRLLPR
jgi:ATP-dependent DNA ligase